MELGGDVGGGQSEGLAGCPLRSYGEFWGYHVLMGYVKGPGEAESQQSLDCRTTKGRGQKEHTRLSAETPKGPEGSQRETELARAATPCDLGEHLMD